MAKRKIRDGQDARWCLVQAHAVHAPLTPHPSGMTSPRFEWSWLLMAWIAAGCSYDLGQVARPCDEDHPCGSNQACQDRRCVDKHGPADKGLADRGPDTAADASSAADKNAAVDKDAVPDLAAADLG